MQDGGKGWAGSWGRWGRWGLRFLLDNSDIVPPELNLTEDD